MANARVILNTIIVIYVRAKKTQIVGSSSEDEADERKLAQALEVDSDEICGDDELEIANLEIVSLWLSMGRSLSILLDML